MERLAERIGTLNVWLLVITVAIGALTLVQMAAASQVDPDQRVPGNQ